MNPWNPSKNDQSLRFSNGCISATTHPFAMFLDIFGIYRSRSLHFCNKNSTFIYWRLYNLTMKLRESSDFPDRASCTGFHCSRLVPITLGFRYDPKSMARVAYTWISTRNDVSGLVSRPGTIGGGQGSSGDVQSSRSQNHEKVIL